MRTERTKKNNHPTAHRAGKPQKPNGARRTAKPARSLRTGATTPASDNLPAAAAEVVSSFGELGLVDGLLRAVASSGYTEPTPIQAQAIPPALAGRDLLGSAQTGTGKTAAFALPILQRLAAAGEKRRAGGTRALVLAPTRELAAQIADSFERYGRGSGLRTTVVFGGVPKRPQYNALRHGVDVLVATPGRLLDLMGEGVITLAGVSVLVLDEADRMLDMGFIHDVRRVVKAMPRERQTMLFSATLPEEIRKLSQQVLIDPARVAVSPVASTLEETEQIAFSIDKPRKVDLLLTLLQDPSMERVLVFSRTKHGANKIAKKLLRAGISTAALHGNKSQGARERALEGFKQGHTRVIVATDIAARGLDVKGLSHVVNYDLPNEPETYVHRIGRTGRAGAVGVALSFCSPEERSYLASIEQLTRRRLNRAELPELIHVPLAPASSVAPPRPSRAKSKQRRGPGNPRRGPANQRRKTSNNLPAARKDETTREAPKGSPKRRRSGEEPQPRAARGSSKSTKSSKAPWWQEGRKVGPRAARRRSKQ